MIPPESEDLVFARLLDIPPAERTEYLRRACADRPGLRARLQELAQSIAATGPTTAPVFLPASETERARALALAFDVDEESSESIVGPYKLLQKIGEGGFGIVWLAEQHAPIRRRVAVKIIKIGMDTEEVIARFEAERQALALMEHPNIARVFDAGATAAGRPYFVMELVRGVAITRYCDENKLSAEARLRLFVTVCQAVQHAHQKGVIHRDLKPSNILVTLHDGVPVPKIIDFGIAKATSARLTEKTLFTQFHTFIGTPAYTSPEQMEMSGLDIDTRSDIYSLGVLLYELLTGQPPFDADTLVKSGLEAMRRTIREIDPPRPSARLSTLTAENRTSIAQQRNTDAGKLSLLLRGDLDWIAMRCLEKDRTRRYDSATALAADIERHLTDELVEARPPSRLYQAKKFVRRHKLAVGAATAIALSLIAGLVASSALFMRERAARRLAVAAQTRALSAEENERVLHREAEVARDAEVQRSARTALDLANRTLAEGNIADGLAYLVYAARNNPGNPALSPRLASVLASHNFALPRAAPVSLGSRVLALRFAQDGRSFHVGTQDGTFRVLDAGTGAVQRQFSAGREIVPGGWEFAPLNDGVVGARTPDNTFALYDLRSGAARIAPFQLPAGAGVPMSSRFLGLSPRGRWIHARALGEFWVWDANSGDLILHLKPPQYIGGCDFNPDEDTLAMVVGHTVQRWSLPSGDVVEPPIRFRPEVPDPQPFGIEPRFSPDGKRIAVIGRRRPVKVFDSSTGTLTHELPGDLVLPGQTDFAGNDRMLIHSDSHIAWWELANGHFSSSPVPAFFEFSLDAAAQRAAGLARDGRLHVIDAGSNAPVIEPAWRQDPGSCMALSPDGTQVLVGTASGLVYHFGLGRGAALPLVVPGTPKPRMPAMFLPEAPTRLLLPGVDHAKVIDAATGREVPGGFRYPEPMITPSSADTHPLIRRDLKFMVVRTASRGWQSWELGADGVTRVMPLQDAVDFPHIPTFSSTGNLVAISSNREPRVWDLRTGVPVGPTLAHPGLPVPFSFSFHPDGRRLAVGGADGSALVFDPATGQPVLGLATRRQVRTWATRFSPDGERILTTNQEGENRLWNARTGQAIGPSVHTRLESPIALFSDDGRWAAIGSAQSVTLLDGQTGTVVGIPIPVGGQVVCFSADSRRLATARHAHAQVWDVPSGEPVTEPMRHSSPQADVPEFSPDGRFLKTENLQELNLWAVPPPLPEGMPPPEWLLELATLCAGQVVDDAGQLVPPKATDADIERVRMQIAALPADAPLADWARWLLDERPDRPIAPGFTMLPDTAARLKVPAETPPAP